MLPPSRRLAIVEAEVGSLAMAMKRGQLWSRPSAAAAASGVPDSLHPALLRAFLELKRALSALPGGDLDALDPNVFLGPFLDVIRSESVTGPVTGLALAAVNKFLAYDLLHEGQANVANAVENLADAVTHARFVGVDPSSDEIVLMKIMEVLRTLMLSPVGLLLTNESVCEIMQSTFRICFENRLSELLRKTAEHSLNDMIQLLFTRLPTFSEENLPLLKKLKMRNHGDSSRARRKHHGAAAKSRNKPAASPARPAQQQQQQQHNQQQGQQKPQSPKPTTEDASGPRSLPTSSAATPRPVANDKNNVKATITAVSSAIEISQQVANTSVTSDDSALASPTLTSNPNSEMQFSVDQDVLARSPMGSVSDLTAVQSDAEESQVGAGGPESLQTVASAENGKEDEKEEEKAEDVVSQDDENQEVRRDSSQGGVEITVTSPKGTVTTGVSPARKESDNKAMKENPPAVNEDEAAPQPPTAATTGQLDEPGKREEFVNSQGVTFTPTAEMVDESGSLIPYGLPCVRELFRFLISLINPHDSHNHDSMIQIALSLLSTALESGADSLSKFESLLVLVKDDLARNLTSLLSAERIATFSATLWLSYIMIESQRRHLKYQMEIFFNKLNDIVCSESQKVTYEHKELALDLLVRLYRLPGLITQLYLNFDCDMYTSNTFEDLTKMLSKNAFPVTGLYSTHFLSLDALLTVIEAIETQCQKRILAGGGSRDANEDSAHAQTIGQVTQKDLSSGAADASSPHVSKCSGHQFGSTLAAAKAVAANHKGAIEQRQMKIPTHEEVMALKHKKKLITTATEQFNAKPAKGVAYMQECGLLKSSPEPHEIAEFLRQNPHLDKKQLGDYISNRKNLIILEAFCHSFDFCGVRIDEALRQFLETFRLPGEAPLITLILEHFADHWFKSNEGTPVATPDSAFTLSYAVIMLNVDQHNKNHTKTNDPMTEEQFKKNLRGTNDGKDHDQEMLREIFHAIKNEEIVMPAEQTGLVRENYLWKCVLKRGHEAGSNFILAENGFFDHDIFSIIWGPTVAALSYVFDKSDDADVVRRALNGFQRCAMIAAHYHMSDVFDNLVISLCKFSTLMTVSESAYYFLPVFGANQKAMFATKMVFGLVQKHGDILRDGWKNVTECLLQLFKCRLLPPAMMESEDFLDAKGKVQLYREEKQAAKAETGLLNSFVSFISMSSEVQQRERTREEEEFADVAAKCIRDCSLDSLVTESKFLLAESLQELVKFLVSGSQLDSTARESGDAGATNGSGAGASNDEHATLFFLEMLVRVTIQNRDRVGIIWQPVSDHLSRLIMSSTSVDKTFLLERAVTALMRLAVRLSRKEDLASLVVQSLRILLALKVNITFLVCRHIAFGLHELLRNNAANIHEAEDWAIIFGLIEVVGAGVNPSALSPGPRAEGNGAKPKKRAPRPPRRPDEDSGHGASSESETANSRNGSPIRRERSESIGSGGWIVLGNSPTKQQLEQPPAATTTEDGLINFNKGALVHVRPLVMHDSLSFLKCCESLAFLIRDVAHITPHNFRHCVVTIRTFVEASFQGRTAATSAENLQAAGAAGGSTAKKSHASRSHAKRTPMGRAPPMRRVRSAPYNMDYDADESDGEDYSSEYLHVALQLLDLMHTLHTRAGQIHQSWAEESGQQLEQAAMLANLWPIAWCPLLQGMARLCCDKRSHIRTSALTSLQRALLFQDLQSLSPREWESAFTAVLFPMLDQLLLKSNPGEKTAMEETRTRAATLLGKVFLQHLAPLTTLPTFTSLWLTVLDFMQRFISAASSDLLADAVPESLKNMLLVMDTAGIFFDEGGATTALWGMTKEKLDTFLPKLMEELFGRREQQSQQQVQDQLAQQQQQTQDQQGPQQAQEQLEQNQEVQLGGGADDEEPAANVTSQIPAETMATQAPATSATVAEEGIPPPSPLDPPVLPSSAFGTVDGASEPPPLHHGQGDACKGEEPSSSSSALPPPPSLPQALAQPPPFSIGPVPSLLPTSALRSSTAVVTQSPTSTGPIRIPSLPEIAPMPPPPIPIAPASTAAAASPASAAGFQPIQPMPPPAAAYGAPQVATPRPLPANPQLATYFAAQMVQPPPSGAAPPPPNLAANILTAAFTPTVPAMPGWDGEKGSPGQAAAAAAVAAENAQTSTGQGPTDNKTSFV